MKQIILFHLLFGTAVSAHSQVWKGTKLVDDRSKSKLDDIFEAQAKNAMKHIDDETKLFEDTLRVLNTDTTNVCTGITPGNLTTCGGKSCLNNTGTIGSCSCVSTSNSTQTTSCSPNNGTILSDSCNGAGYHRCAYNGIRLRSRSGSGSGDGYISNSSCNAGQYDTIYVCLSNGIGGPGSGKGSIGQNSCNNASSIACTNNGAAMAGGIAHWAGKAEGHIESNSCNDIRDTKNIGSCQDNGACYSNFTSYGKIGPSSCNNVTSSCGYNGKSSVRDSYGIIGPHSCNNGTDSCNSNGMDGNGTIGAHSCNGGPFTCERNGHIIGNNACNAPGACKHNEGTIGDGCCNYTNACLNNKKTIKLGDVGCFEPTPSSPAPTVAPHSSVTTPSTSVIVSLLTFLVTVTQVL